MPISDLLLSQPLPSIPANVPLERLLPRRTGTVRDFDFLAGAWRIHNRSRKANGAVTDTWIEFPSSTRMTILLGGVMNVEEVQFPATGHTAAALRLFDVERAQWAIYWVDSRSGVLEPPVFGGFIGDRGEFYGLDKDGDQTVLCQFVWTRQGADRARWEQAYSLDGEAWEVNWTMEFTRAE
jgi:hypothetical protein